MTDSTSKASRHVEVERKFDVPGSVTMPSFEGIVGVSWIEKLPVQTLAAIYFDTAAHDLATKKITLRRRTGGLDAGWHLKLPASPDARTEVRAALGAVANPEDDPIPGELLAMVREIVADRPLAPVAWVTTTREVHRLYGPNDTALAEFCDDLVTAQAIAACDASALTPAEQHWREWELELLSAGANLELLDRLGERLIHAGAQPAGHGSKLARVLDAFG
ncbi:MAG: CYTH domain-containing protein [Mycobacteriaceae bacterium]|nr:CYTH domain-containing protein [Mycobacteriaceae bacterium]